MGFKISWLAFSGKSKSDVLASMHVADTAVPDEATEGPMSVADFPDNWTIVWLNSFNHPLAEDASLRRLSTDCTLIASHVHEGIMFSAAQLYREGKLVWSISHDSSEGIYNLNSKGELPTEFAAVKDTLLAKQRAQPDGPMSVDYVFNIPLDTAKSLCGFQHDRWKYEWGRPNFTELKNMDAS